MTFSCLIIFKDTAQRLTSICEIKINAVFVRGLSVVLQMQNSRYNSYSTIYSNGFIGKLFRELCMRYFNYLIILQMLTNRKLYPTGLVQKKPSFFDSLCLNLGANSHF